MGTKVTGLSQKPGLFNSCLWYVFGIFNVSHGNYQAESLLRVFV